MSRELASFVEDFVVIRHGERLDLLLAGNLLMFACEHPPAAQPIERLVLGRSHQPGGGPVGHAGRRPPLEGDDQRVLGQVLGLADVAHHAGKPGDQPGPLDPPDGLDRGVG